MTTDRSEFVDANELACPHCGKLALRVEFDTDKALAGCSYCGHVWPVAFKPISAKPDLAHLEALAALNRVVDAITDARNVLEALQELCADKDTTEELDHRGVRALRACDELEMRALSWTRRLRQHWDVGYRA